MIHKVSNPSLSTMNFVDAIHIEWKFDYEDVSEIWVQPNEPVMFDFVGVRSWREHTKRDTVNFKTWQNALIYNIETFLILEVLSEILETSSECQSTRKNVSFSCHHVRGFSIWRWAPVLFRFGWAGQCIANTSACFEFQHVIRISGEIYSMKFDRKFGIFLQLWYA